jgi:hypothetical protein|tara:strand:+ start:239 stop:691 length:453 start_codon:yes stop_codon:yes gene_type:complete
MVSFSVKVVGEDNKPISNVTVIAKQDIYFSRETKEKESITDNNGIVFFDGDILTTYQIEASKDGSYDSGVIRVNIVDTTPEFLQLQLFFNPTKKVEQILGKTGGEVLQNARTLSIGFAVVGSAVVVLYLLNKASSKSIPTVKIPNKVNLK